MKFFVFDLRDSDGNDCTVYDLVVSGEDKDAAIKKIDEFIKAEWPDDESDGGEGTFHPCDCTCEHRETDWRAAQSGEPGVCDECSDTWECNHGGLLLDTYNVEEFATEREASDACRPYHRSIILHDDEKETA